MGERGLGLGLGLLGCDSGAAGGCRGGGGPGRQGGECCTGACRGVLGRWWRRDSCSGAGCAPAAGTSHPPLHPIPHTLRSRQFRRLGRAPSTHVMSRRTHAHTHTGTARWRRRRRPARRAAARWRRLWRPAAAASWAPRTRRPAPAMRRCMCCCGRRTGSLRRCAEWGGGGGEEGWGGEGRGLGNGCGGGEAGCVSASLLLCFPNTRIQPLTP